MHNVDQMAVEDGGGEDDGGEEFSSQFLIDSGEGAELELMIDDDEVPLTNSDAVCIKSLLIIRCINRFVLHLLMNHFSFSPPDLAELRERRKEARPKL